LNVKADTWPFWRVLLTACVCHLYLPTDEVFIRIISGAFGALLYAMKGSGQKQGLTDDQNKSKLDAGKQPPT
jgi:hypothetical protein